MQFEAVSMKESASTLFGVLGFYAPDKTPNSIFCVDTEGNDFALPEELQFCENKLS